MIEYRLYNVTAGIPVAGFTPAAVCAQAVNVLAEATAPLGAFLTQAANTTYRLEARRLSGPTWTTSRIQAGTTARRIKLIL